MVRVLCTFRKHPTPRDKSRAIICPDESLDAEFCHLVRRRSPWGATRLPVATLALSSRAGGHLFFGVLLTGVSDSRAPRAQRFAARKFVPGAGGAVCGRVALLVCSHAFVAEQQRPCADGSVLGRHDPFVVVIPQSLATRHAGSLVRIVSFLRVRRAGVFRLSIGRDAALSRIYQLLFCAARMASHLGR